MCIGYSSQVLYIFVQRTERPMSLPQIANWEVPTTWAQQSSASSISSILIIKEPKALNRKYIKFSMIISAIWLFSLTPRTQYRKLKIENWYWKLSHWSPTHHTKVSNINTISNIKSSWKWKIENDFWVVISSESCIVACYLLKPNSGQKYF